MHLKGSIPHPIYACVFRNSLYFVSTYRGYANQGKYLETAMH